MHPLRRVGRSLGKVLERRYEFDLLDWACFDGVSVDGLEEF